ncbi:hypothetical protein DYQ93_14745 [Xanthomonas sp. LMG 8992]|nr:hypothetical protein [Xanthomonas sp. LMG 8992]
MSRLKPLLRKACSIEADVAAVAAALAVAWLRLWLLPWLLIYRVPFRSGGQHGEKPEGRRTWMCAVRGRGRMPLPRIPVMDADPERAARRARGRVRRHLSATRPSPGQAPHGASPFAGAKQCFAFIRLTHVPAKNDAHPARRPSGIRPPWLPRREDPDKSTATAGATAKPAAACSPPRHSLTHLKPRAHSHIARHPQMTPAKASDTKNPASAGFFAGA